MTYQLDSLAEANDDDVRTDTLLDETLDLFEELSGKENNTGGSITHLEREGEVEGWDEQDKERVIH